jgi:ABC-2 type transport system ATP-binding protein
MVAIFAENLSKDYRGHTALHALNLQVKTGEIYCLLGQNGAGKTTTINLFLGFTQPTSGTAHIQGVPLGKPTEQKVSYIPEVVQLYPLLSGLENLDFFSRLAGFRYSHDKLSALLQQAGLQPDAHKTRVGTYSKGMRQKVGIAIALASQAKVIFMDEPTSGLDPKATAEFTILVKKLAEDGHTILMATHDIFNAVQIGNRIGIMNKGKLIHELNSHEVTADSLQQLYLETV